MPDVNDSERQWVSQRLAALTGSPPPRPASPPASPSPSAGAPPASEGAPSPAAVAVPPGLAEPSSSRSPLAAAFDPGRPGVKALAAVAVLVVVVAAGLAWFSRPHPQVVAPARSGTAAPAEPANGAMIVVAIAGRVRFPGLLRLAAGARVADAIEAAGGVLPGTDLSTVNLARKLTDGELITIGLPVAAGSVAGRLNLNTATVSQLDALPGVGPVLAQRIVEYRTRKGSFHSVDELRQVDGIGDAKFTQLKELVTV